MSVRTIIMDNAMFIAFIYPSYFTDIQFTLMSILTWTPLKLLTLFPFLTIETITR